MTPNFFPVYCIILIILAVAVPRVVSEDDQRFVSCRAESECGNTKMKISYPFWGGDRPDYCGHPEFELDCGGDAPEFTMNEASYRVLDINNSTNTVTVARADYWDDYCPSNYVNTDIDSTLFSFNSTTYPNATLYYRCLYAISMSNQFNCSGNDIICYFAILDISLGSLSPGTCDFVVSIPIFQSAATAIVSGGGTVSLLREAIKEGFGLLWNANNSLCKECADSGGHCGYNSGQFVCYCPDGPSSASNTCGNTTTSPTAGSSKRLPRKIVIGILTGVAGVIIILVLLFFLRRKCLVGTKFGLKKQRKDDKKVEEFIRSYGSLAPKRYNYSDIKKMTNSLAYKLGQGGFGSVYKGTLPDGRLVAVKVLSELKGNGEEFMNEVASISRTFHVNIVTLIGFCYSRTKRALIYELMPNGSLDKFISDTESELEWRTTYQIAMGIARGLEYLHRGCHTRILHFDIKPHNILLDEHFCPKISDFGLAKLCQMKESIISMTGARGTVGYIAPEVFCRNFGGVSHKSDVYSYGMLVLEMVGGRKNRGAACSTSDTYFPDWIYKHLEDGEDLILRGVVTQEEEETVRKMILVSLWCIQTNPIDRPSIEKVVRMLEGNLQSLETPPKPFLFSPKKPPQESSTTSLSMP